MIGGADAGAAALATRIAWVCRELRGTVPTPRGAPFFGLDVEVPFSPKVLESLADPGIFRKYERVLLQGGRRGGEARWLAAHLGCRVVVAADDAEALRLADLLNRRVHAEEAVAFVRAPQVPLPVRKSAFTHAWMIGLPQADAAAAIAEIAAAIRPGGHFALQLAAPLAAATAAVLTAACEQAGLEGMHWREVPAAPWPPSFRIARERARRAAAELWGGSDVVALWPEHDPLPAVLPQLHARRPS